MLLKQLLEKKQCKLHELQVWQPVGISYTLTTRLISCNSGKQSKCNAKILGLTKPLRNETMRRIHMYAGGNFENETCCNLRRTKGMASLVENTNANNIEGI